MLQSRVFAQYTMAWKPNTCQSVTELNQTTAKIGSFIVRVCHAGLIQYEYSDKTSQVPVQGKRFQCVLIGWDPDTYMTGQVRSNNAAVSAASAQFQDGTV